MIIYNIILSKVTELYAFAISLAILSFLRQMTDGRHQSETLLVPEN